MATAARLRWPQKPDQGCAPIPRFHAFLCAAFGVPSLAADLSRSRAAPPARRGSASPPRRTEARAKRTLEPTRINILWQGSGGALPRLPCCPARDPRRAAGGKMALLRFEKALEVLFLGITPLIIKRPVEYVQRCVVSRVGPRRLQNLEHSHVGSLCPGGCTY